ncbi:31218_t:CDS:2 [Racocetra persica]|uniref:31218_t:CDS:1 n=1 Tax=Racocetra persica TaxID=160502 RepID=A0ACA9MXU6_9GLOM|nr:31218_t:CDS:2 [Racocetra persica]
MASVKKDPEIDNKDVVINVLTKNYVDQSYVDLKLTCYHPTSIYYLTNMTAVIKKDSVNIKVEYDYEKQPNAIFVEIKRPK